MAHEAPIRHTAAPLAIPTPSRLRCSHTSCQQSTICRQEGRRSIFQRQRNRLLRALSGQESEATQQRPQLALLQHDA